MGHKLLVTTIALVLAFAFSRAGAAGQSEDSLFAPPRGDFTEANRLVRPRANHVDFLQAQRAVGLSQPSPQRRTPELAPVGIMHIVLGLAVAIVVAAALVVAWRSRQARPNAANANNWTRLPSTEILELRQQMELGSVAPPGSIVFEFDDVERTDNSFTFRAFGEHEGREFGFRLRWTKYYGPVALCEWWRSGEESDALIDIFADKAGISRGDSRFEEYVRSAAIVLGASPADVPFAQRTKIQSKVCFDLAEGQPEITMDLDFASKTGTIEERDSEALTDLVRAFHVPEKAAPVDEDAGYRTD